MTMVHIPLEQSIYQEESVSPEAQRVKKDTKLTTYLSMFCFCCWLTWGAFYVGYKKGSSYEMKRLNHKLQHAHAVITGGMTKDKEGK